MESFEWNKLSELGIEVIDREHREILNMINSLRNTLRSDNHDGAKRVVLSGVLEEGIAFTRNHFAAEESLMQMSSYPAYLDHKNEHELFLKRLDDLHAQVRGGVETLTPETLGLLGNWLHHHVLETDKPIVLHLVKAGLSHSAVGSRGKVTSDISIGPIDLGTIKR